MPKNANVECSVWNATRRQHSRTDDPLTHKSSPQGEPERSNNSVQRTMWIHQSSRLLRQQQGDLTWCLVFHRSISVHAYTVKPPQQLRQGRMEECGQGFVGIAMALMPCKLGLVPFALALSQACRGVGIAFVRRPCCLLLGRTRVGYQRLPSEPFLRLRLHLR